MSEVGKARLNSVRQAQKERRKQIYDEFVAGATVKDLGEKYHVTPATISNLLNRAEKDQTDINQP